MDDTLKNALLAAAVLDQLGVRWFLGGSLASSLLGTPRATLDADIVADLSTSHIKPFISALGDDWYADEGAIRDAIANRSSFNLIHMENALKVDVFIPKRRSFDAAQFGRLTYIPVEEGSEVEAPVCSAEDIVVAKLEWYKLGGEISERQWGDILGVLRGNRGLLDLELMTESAIELAVEALLKKAIGEAE